MRKVLLSNKKVYELIATNNYRGYEEDIKDIVENKYAKLLTYLSSNNKYHEIVSLKLQQYINEHLSIKESKSYFFGFSKELLVHCLKVYFYDALYHENTHHLRCECAQVGKELQTDQRNGHWNGKQNGKSMEQPSQEEALLKEIEQNAHLIEMDRLHLLYCDEYFYIFKSILHILKECNIFYFYQNYNTEDFSYEHNFMYELFSILERKLNIQQLIQIYFDTYKDTNNYFEMIKQVDLENNGYWVYKYILLFLNVQTFCINIFFFLQLRLNILEKSNIKSILSIFLTFSSINLSNRYYANNDIITNALQQKEYSIIFLIASVSNFLTLEDINKYVKCSSSINFFKLIFLFKNNISTNNYQQNVRLLSYCLNYFDDMLQNFSFIDYSCVYKKVLLNILDNALCPDEISEHLREEEHSGGGNPGSGIGSGTGCGTGCGRASQTNNGYRNDGCSNDSGSDNTEEIGVKQQFTTYQEERNSSCYVTPTGGVLDERGYVSYNGSGHLYDSSSNHSTIGYSMHLRGKGFMYKEGKRIKDIEQGKRHSLTERDLHFSLIKNIKKHIEKKEFFKKTINSNLFLKICISLFKKEDLLLFSYEIKKNYKNIKTCIDYLQGDDLQYDIYSTSYFFYDYNYRSTEIVITEEERKKMVSPFISIESKNILLEMSTLFFSYDYLKVYSVRANRSRELSRGLGRLRCKSGKQKRSMQKRKQHKSSNIYHPVILHNVNRLLLEFFCSKICNSSINALIMFNHNLLSIYRILKALIGTSANLINFSEVTKAVQSFSNRCYENDDNTVTILEDTIYYKILEILKKKNLNKNSIYITYIEYYYILLDYYCKFLYSNYSDRNESNNFSKDGMFFFFKNIINFFCKILKINKCFHLLIEIKLNNYFKLSYDIRNSFISLFTYLFFFSIRFKELTLLNYDIVSCLLFLLKKININKLNAYIFQMFSYVEQEQLLRKERNEHLYINKGRNIFTSSDVDTSNDLNSNYNYEKICTNNYNDHSVESFNINYDNLTNFKLEKDYIDIKDKFRIDISFLKIFFLLSEVRRVDLTEDGVKTSEKDSGKTSEKDSGKTSEKDSGKTSEKDSGKTSEKDSGKTSEKDSGKTSEKDSGKNNDKDSGKTSNDDGSKTSNEHLKEDNSCYNVNEKYENNSSSGSNVCSSDMRGGKPSPLYGSTVHPIIRVQRYDKHNGRGATVYRSQQGGRVVSPCSYNNSSGRNCGGSNGRRSGQSSDRSNGQSSDRSNGQSSDRSNGQSSDRSNGQSSDRSNGQSSSRSSGRRNSHVNYRQQDLWRNQENARSYYTTECISLEEIFIITLMELCAVENYRFTFVNDLLSLYEEEKRKKIYINTEIILILFKKVIKRKKLNFFFFNIYKTLQNKVNHILASINILIKKWVKWTFKNCNNTFKREKNINIKKLVKLFFISFYKFVKNYFVQIHDFIDNLKIYNSKNNFDDFFFLIFSKYVNRVFIDNFSASFIFSLSKYAILNECMSIINYMIKVSSNVNIEQVRQIHAEVMNAVRKKHPQMVENDSTRNAINGINGNENNNGNEDNNGNENRDNNRNSYNCSNNKNKSSSRNNDISNIKNSNGYGNGNGNNNNNYYYNETADEGVHPLSTYRMTNKMNELPVNHTVKPYSTTTFNNFMNNIIISHKTLLNKPDMYIKKKVNIFQIDTMSNDQYLHNHYTMDYITDLLLLEKQAKDGQKDFCTHHGMFHAHRNFCNMDSNRSGDISGNRSGNRSSNYNIDCKDNYMSNRKDLHNGNIEKLLRQSTINFNLIDESTNENSVNQHSMFSQSEYLTKYNLTFFKYFCHIRNLLKIIFQNNYVFFLSDFLLMNYEQSGKKKKKNIFFFNYNLNMSGDCFSSVFNLFINEYNAIYYKSGHAILSHFKEINYRKLYEQVINRILLMYSLLLDPCYHFIFLKEVKVIWTNISNQIFSLFNTSHLISNLFSKASFSIIQKNDVVSKSINNDIQRIEKKMFEGRREILSMSLLYFVLYNFKNVYMLYEKLNTYFRINSFNNIYFLCKYSKGYLPLADILKLFTDKLLYYFEKVKEINFINLKYEYTKKIFNILKFLYFFIKNNDLIHVRIYEDIYDILFYIIKDFVDRDKYVHSYNIKEYTFNKLKILNLCLHFVNDIYFNLFSDDAKGGGRTEVGTGTEVETGTEVGTGTGTETGIGIGVCVGSEKYSEKKNHLWNCMEELLSLFAVRLQKNASLFLHSQLFTCYRKDMKKELYNYIYNMNVMSELLELIIKGIYIKDSCIYKLIINICYDRNICRIFFNINFNNLNELLRKYLDIHKRKNDSAYNIKLLLSNNKNILIEKHGLINDDALIENMIEVFNEKNIYYKYILNLAESKTAQNGRSEQNYDNIFEDNNDYISVKNMLQKKIELLDDDYVSLKFFEGKSKIYGERNFLFDINNYYYLLNAYNNSRVCQECSYENDDYTYTDNDTIFSGNANRFDEYKTDDKLKKKIDTNILKNMHTIFPHDHGQAKSSKGGTNSDGKKKKKEEDITKRGNLRGEEGGNSSDNSSNVALQRDSNKNRNDDFTILVAGGIWTNDELGNSIGRYILRDEKLERKKKKKKEKKKHIFYIGNHAIPTVFIFAKYFKNEINCMKYINLTQSTYDSKLRLLLILYKFIIIIKHNKIFEDDNYRKMEKLYLQKCHIKNSIPFLFFVYESMITFLEPSVQVKKSAFYYILVINILINLFSLMNVHDRGGTKKRFPRAKGRKGESEGEKHNKSENEKYNKSEGEKHNKSEGEKHNKSEDEKYNKSEDEKHNKSEGEKHNKGMTYVHGHNSGKCGSPTANDRNVHNKKSRAELMESSSEDDMEKYSNYFDSSVDEDEQYNTDSCQGSFYCDLFIDKSFIASIKNRKNSAVFSILHNMSKKEIDKYKFIGKEFAGSIWDNDHEGNGKNEKEVEHVYGNVHDKEDDKAGGKADGKKYKEKLAKERTKKNGLDKNSLIYNMPLFLSLFVRAITIHLHYFNFYNKNVYILKNFNALHVPNSIMKYIYPANHFNINLFVSMLELFYVSARIYNNYFIRINRNASIRKGIEIEEVVDVVKTRTKGKNSVKMIHTDYYNTTSEGEKSREIEKQSGDKECIRMNKNRSLNEQNGYTPDYTGKSLYLNMYIITLKEILKECYEYHDIHMKDEESIRRCYYLEHMLLYFLYNRVNTLYELLYNFFFKFLKGRNSNIYSSSNHYHLQHQLQHQYHHERRHGQHHSSNVFDSVNENIYLILENIIYDQINKINSFLDNNEYYYFYINTLTFITLNTHVCLHMLKKDILTKLIYVPLIYHSLFDKSKSFSAIYYVSDDQYIRNKNHIIFCSLIVLIIKMLYIFINTVICSGGAATAASIGANNLYYYSENAPYHFRTNFMYSMEGSLVPSFATAGNVMYSFTSSVGGNIPNSNELERNNNFLNNTNINSNYANLDESDLNKMQGGRQMNRKDDKNYHNDEIHHKNKKKWEIKMDGHPITDDEIDYFLDAIINIIEKLSDRINFIFLKIEKINCLAIFEESYLYVELLTKLSYYCTIYNINNFLISLMDKGGVEHHIYYINRILEKFIYEKEIIINPYSPYEIAASSNVAHVKGKKKIKKNDFSLFTQRVLYICYKSILNYNTILLNIIQSPYFTYSYFVLHLYIMILKSTRLVTTFIEHFGRRNTTLIRTIKTNSGFSYVPICLDIVNTMKVKKKEKIYYTRGTKGKSSFDYYLSESKSESSEMSNYSNEIYQYNRSIDEYMNTTRIYRNDYLFNFLPEMIHLKSYYNILKEILERSAYLGAYLLDKLKYSCEDSCLKQILFSNVCSYLIHINTTLLPSNICSNNLKKKCTIVYNYVVNIHKK
ncbi:hypothetical protein MKS88_001137 [Plasmodium brasilianum]|uniref:Uncharacterized protein n=1 Tax=Plasmodium brasilianum TaxID=5824 RepID=A0ACB9YF26_PLABR|nr:hypothetical protein MKS88_001137 [Plasmodium brasilianum]